MSSSTEAITYRVNISSKNRNVQITIEPQKFMNAFLGKKIGDTVNGGLFGYEGYEFTITGGCDTAGFPMRKDVQGGVKKRILVGKPSTGIKAKRFNEGDRIRILVRGNTVTDQIVMVNCVVSKEGKVKLFVPKEGDAAAPAAEGDEKDKGKKKKEK
ncbi:MAG: S6e family ribosomal protein [Candidatus Sigynarchaeota archaeon]